ncbi:MAG: response regulator transcription factor [Alicyclobacillus sp.]|nr:response regulator transcription factor [Alicyclobacillus sp.]
MFIVDDEESIRKLVDYNFQRAGFRTEVLSRGDEAYERVRTDPASLDIMILDIMLPGMDGMEVCKRLRQEHIKLPIILLTARDEEIDRILGLELGADDYVTKPFSPRELVARARAVLRRIEEQPESRVHASAADEHPVTVGDITFDRLRHEVTVRGTPVELTPKEFELLHFFILNRDRVLARDQLLQQVWGYTVTPDTRIVDAHVSHLREKLESNPKDPVYIRTIRGVGYKFTDGSGRTG